MPRGAVAPRRTHLPGPPVHPHPVELVPCPLCVIGAAARRVRRAGSACARAHVCVRAQRPRPTWWVAACVRHPPGALLWTRQQKPREGPVDPSRDGSNGGAPPRGAASNPLAGGRGRPSRTRMQGVHWQGAHARSGALTTCTLRWRTCALGPVSPPAPGQRARPRAAQRQRARRRAGAGGVVVEVGGVSRGHCHGRCAFFQRSAGRAAIGARARALA
jgi:hypothetical protein